VRSRQARSLGWSAALQVRIGLMSGPGGPRSVSGTEGYGETADILVKQYESLAFANVHRHVLHLFPATPSTVLDIGAGTGRDAAGFCELGHAVTAGEPTGEMRAHGQRVQGHFPVRWIHGWVPALGRRHALGERTDVAV